MLMGSEDDRTALPRRIRRIMRQTPRATLHVLAGCGLVEEDKLGIAGDGRGEADSLGLATRQGDASGSARGCRSLLAPP